jgi:preprotein translocase subunit SecG
MEKESNLEKLLYLVGIIFFIGMIILSISWKD